MKYSKVSIILPFYKQSGQMRAVVESYVNPLSGIGIDYEIILAPNGPDDGSARLGMELSKEFDKVRLVTCERSGWGHAVLTGLRAATGDLLCYTNSARTTPQDLLLCVLYAVSNPGVVIKAARKIRESWFRRLGSLLYNLQCRALFDISYWDINGTPKVFPREFEALLNLTCEDDLIDLDFSRICSGMNYPLLEVPIFSTRRYSGKSTTGLRSAFRMYWGAYRLWHAGAQ